MYVGDDAEPQGRPIGPDAASREESEAKYRALFEASTDALFVETLRGEVLDCNAAACRLFGYSRDELIGLTVADLVPDDVAHTLPGVIGEEMAAGGVFVETANRRRDGQSFPCEVSTRLVTVAGEQFVIACVRDTTERRRASAELEAFARQQSALFELSCDLTAGLDEDTVCARVVAGLHERLGYQSLGLFLVDGPTGDRVLRASVGWAGIAPGYRLPPGRGLSERPLLDGRAHYRPDVSAEPAHVPGAGGRSEIDVPLRIADRVLGVLVVEDSRPDAFDQNDVTVLSAAANQASVALERAREHQAIKQELAERRRLEEQNETRRRYLESVLACAPDAIVTLDAGHRVMEWNAGAERLFGYTPAEAVGRDLDTLIAACDADTQRQAKELTRHVLGKSPVPPFETVRYHSDGTPVAVIAAGSPILAGGEVIGVVAVYTDIRQRKQNEQIMASRAREMAALYETSLEINSQLDLPALLQAIVRRAAGLLGARMGGLYLLRPDGASIELAVSYELPGNYAGTVLKLGEGLSGEVARTGQALMVDDYSVWEHRAAAFGDEVFRRVLAVPLKIQDRVIGVINITDDRQTGLFTDDDVRLASLFADQAARAIENVRLLSESQRRARELAALYDTALATASVLETDALLARLHEHINRLFAPDVLIVGLYDPDLHEIQLPLAVEKGQVPARPAAGRVPLAEGGLLGRVISTRGSLLAGDVRTDPAGGRPAFQGREVRAWLGVPVIGRDGVLGAIAVQSFTPNAFDDGHRRVLESLASHLAISMDNARLYQEAQQQLRALTALLEASSAVSSSLDVDQVLEASARRAMATLGVEECVVSLWDRERDAIVTLLDYPPQAGALRSEAGATYELKDFPATRAVLAGRRPLAVRLSDAGADPAELSLMRANNTQSLLMIPLLVRDEAVGLLELIELDEERDWTPTEIGLGQALANLAAAALENARLFQAERASRERADALRRAAHAVGASLELNEILRLILDHLRAVLVYDTGSVLLYRDDHMLELIGGAGYENEQRTSQEAARLLPASPLLRRMAQDLVPIVCPDVRQLEGWIWVPGAEHVRAWLAVPLVVQGRMIGVLMADHREPGFFRPGDLQIVQALAKQATQAIEHARLFRAEREQRVLAEALRRATEAVSSTLDLEQVLDRILEQVGRVLPADANGVVLMDQEQARIVRGLGYERFGGPGMAGRIVLDIASMATYRYMIDTGKPIIVPDTHTYPRWVSVPETSWIRSHAAAPIRARDQIVGFLVVDSATPHYFRPAQAELLQMFAESAGLAIANARLYEETVRSNRELALLNRVIAASAASQEIEPILETVCRELVAAFGLTSAAAALLNEERTDLVVVAQSPLDGPVSVAVGASVAVQDQPLAGYLCTQQEPLVIADTGSDPQMVSLLQAFRHDQAASLLVVPLIVAEQTAGCLALAVRQPRAFPAHEVDLAARVARQVSGALARVRLAKTQQRLSIAVEQAAESVVITDTAGRILYVNPAFERVTGYSWAEAAGESPRLFKSEQHDDAFYDQMWATIASDRVWKGRIVNRKKDGSLYTEESTISPVHNQAGEVVNYVAVNRDVTREAELEEQFRQAQKMEAMGRLAGGIAHDFNNLLTVIQVSTWLLQRQIRHEDPLWEIVERIQDTVGRAAKLIRQLLSFSRRQIVEPQTVYLNQVVGDLGHMLQRIIGEDIRLVTSLAAELWPVRVDLSQLEQVIMNLVVNARDAMPHGGTLTIETSNVVLDDTYVAYHVGAQPGEHVLLAIGDTGIGMTDEVKAHLFEPFFTTKARGQGTGLGLSTVFGIVNLSKGHVWVDSVVGKGTVFKIYLPRDENALPPAPAPSVPVVAGGTGTETILVVEDETAVRDLVVRILAGHGYRILAAQDPIEALDLSTSHPGPIDLLLTDVIMPHMNGRELAAELRQDRPEMRVVYMSGYTDNAMASPGVLDPGTVLLAKPFTMETLLHQVRDVLDEADG